MCKFCWMSVVVLLVITAVVTYKFVLQGSVAESTDARTAILLEKNERDLVLSEMRIFLESIQQITRGISERDMKQVADAARQSGLSAQGEVPGSLIGKLPLAFKQLGFDTHRKFDALALDAQDMEDPGHALSQMNTILGNCVACHKTYRFELASP